MRLVLFVLFLSWALALTPCAWQMQQPTGAMPVPRFDMGLACINQNQFLMFGGNQLSGGPFDDAWIYSGSSWQRLPSASPLPAPRADFAFAPVSIDAVLLYGGANDTEVFSDAWLFTSGDQKWQLTSFSPPLPPLTCTCSAALPNGLLVLYGGHAAISPVVPTSTLFILDPAKGLWVNLTQPPSTSAPLPRVWAACSTQGSVLWLSGGFNGSAEMGDLWSVDLSAYVDTFPSYTSPPRWERIQPSGPQPTPRSGHTILLGDSKLFVSGGEVHLQYASGDLWDMQKSDSNDDYVWQNVTAELSHPTARLGARIAQCGDTAAIFGGVSGWINSTLMNDLWITFEC